MNVTPGEWIRVYDDVLPDDLCREASEMVDASGTRFDGGYRNCRMLALLTAPGTDAIYGRIRDVAAGLFDRYKGDVPHNGNLNFCNHLEVPSIVKYEPGGADLYTTHADIWSPDSALRQVSVIFYFNDVAEGGETVFPIHDRSVAPRRGRALFFPSFYMFPHSAAPPVSGPKYVAVIWICFPPCAGHYNVMPLR